MWRHGRVRAVSGLPAPVADAPFTVWTAALCKHLSLDGAAEPRVVDGAGLPESIRREWSDFLPAYALWLPLSPRRPAEDGLLLARDQPWSQSDVPLLAQLAHAGGHALAAHEPKHWSNPLRLRRRRPLLWLLAVAAAAALLLPFRMTVLAPGEVIPRDPVVVRAPLSGVVAEVMVQPNQVVKTHDVLARLNSRELDSRLLVVRQGLETALAQYRLSTQSGIVDPKAQADAAIAKAQADEHQAEVAQVQELLSRITINAESDGLALFPDAAALTGKPVRLGERLMILADPTKIEVEVMIPVADNVGFAAGDEVDLFLNTAPDHAVHARLRNVNYQAEPTPEGPAAFRAVADIVPGQEVPRIGLRGTAKIYGQSVTLGYLLLRRPIAAARQALGM